MKKIHILVVEDNRLLRERISTMLASESDIKVTAALDNGETLLRMLDTTNADVVLLDLGLGNHENLRLVRAIKKSRPAIFIIVMDLIENQSLLLEYVQAGVVGFILKDATAREVVHTIRSVAGGVTVFPPHLAASLFSQSMMQRGRFRGVEAFGEAGRTTKRQRQVIDLIATGLTNKEIARTLHLSPYTVKSHVHNILEKFSLHTRVQIANHVRKTDPYAGVFTTLTLFEN
ncbi:MAG TPA: response regulator transcription factor [Bacteroidota bacterium]|nr:response regulator transcription factor [Bacteroidota bacterium]